VAATPFKHAYSREQVRRLAGVSERSLRNWERRGLLPQGESFGFSDLIAVQTLVKLTADRIPPARIAQAVDALRKKLRHVSNPLREVTLVAEGKRIHVLLDGQRMEAISGQLLLNFDEGDLNKLLDFPGDANDSRRLQRRRTEAARWFQRGLELEGNAAPIEEILEAYEKSVELDDCCVGALVNLGTIYFHARAWNEAERYYRQALEADPNYALAHFNLGNLFDERGDVAKALFHYQSALRVAPQYADAHYNLALLAQRTGQFMKAVQHWRIYLKLDPSSDWATIARRELGKLRDAAVIQGKAEPQEPETPVS
jgi:tetratricopeptide (TPR) repeat protein